VDALRQASGGVPFVRAGRHGGRSAPPLRGQPRRRQRDLELSHNRRSGPLHPRSPKSRNSGRPFDVAAADAGCRANCQETGSCGEKPESETRPEGKEEGQVRCAEKGAESREVREGREAQVAAPVPYLKFSRDKRGYEHFSIVEPGVARRGRPPRPRLLFWFRTPPQVKVGRLPFTEDVRRAIEAQNPGVRFDWPRLLATPIPPPDAEHWRERRRMEKAARQAARETELDEVPGGSEAPDVPPVSEVPEVQGAAEVPEVRDVETSATDDEDDDAVAAADEPEQTPALLQASDSGERVPVAPAPAAGERPAGRRRRRRRRRPRPAGETAAGGSTPSVPVPPTEDV